MSTAVEAPTATGTTARHWIGGEWRDSGEERESFNPSTGEVVGHYFSGGAPEARQAVAAARAAFDAKHWSRDAELRSRALFELADRLEERADALALTLSREGGKLLAQTGWEVAGTLSSIRYSAASALTQIMGSAAEVAPGVYSYSSPEPLGVAGIISPWNSPVILTARALGPALAAGCTAVVKLPGQTALTNAIFAEAVAATELLPDGVVNLFTEAGNEGAPLLVESPDVDIVSYTGSTQVGRTIAAAGAKTLKRMNLELGGKSPLVVFDDADLEATLPTLLMSLIAMNGQFCVTGSRVLVQRSVADEVRRQLAALLEGVRVGPSEDPASHIGPLIDAASATRVDRIVQEASAYATVLVRGGPVEPEGAAPTGAYYQPSLLEVEDVDVPLVQNEVFGPVQTFEVFDDEADAIRRANATEFGLGAAVFTRDEIRARRVARELECGLVWTNTWGVLSDHFEEGGHKQSGIGVLRGPNAISQFQQTKVYTQAAPPSDRSS